MRRARMFAVNALMITLSSLVLRYIAVAFNAFISRKIGAEGMGLFTLVTSIYSFAVTLAVSGISLAATRLCSEAHTYSERRAVMRRCIMYSCIFGICTTVLLLLSSNFIGSVLLGDTRTVIPIRLFALSLTFISLSSSFGGYFTAVRRVSRNVTAQIGEQLIRIAVISAGLMYLAPRGLMWGCIALVGGGAIAESAAFLYYAVVYFIDISHHMKSEDETSGSSLNSDVIYDKQSLTRKLLGISLPVALSAYARSALLTVEHILIPRGLKKYGASPEASLASYGVLCGMVMPIIFFPSAFLSSFSTLLVPELAECVSRGDSERIDSIIQKIFRATIAFSIGAAGIMLCFSYELGTLIYSSPESSVYIKLLAPLIPIMYLDTVTDGMLKGLGEQVYNMRVNIVDSAMSALLVWILLPTAGILGYIAVIYFTELINASLSITRLIQINNFRMITLRGAVVRWVVKPLFCVIGATSCVKLSMSFFSTLYIESRASLALAMAVCALLYIIFLLITGAYGTEDLQWAKKICARAQ